MTRGLLDEDKRYGNPLELVGIYPTELKEGKGVYYAIVKETRIEHIITDEMKETFTKNSLQITPPIEYDALRSVIVKHLDKVLDDYSNDEVIESIRQANHWDQVEEMVRIPTTGRLLKIKFQSASMAKQEIEDGIIILHQKINAKHMEK